MRVIMIMVCTVLLSACGDIPSSSTASNGKNIICLQGVQYYKFSNQVGNAAYGYLAAVYDSNTKQVKLCDVSRHSMGGDYD